MVGVRKIKMIELNFRRYFDSLPRFAAIIGTHNQRIRNELLLSCFLPDRSDRDANFLICEPDAQEFGCSTFNVSVIQLCFMPRLASVPCYKHHSSGNKVTIVIVSKIDLVDIFASVKSVLYPCGTTVSGRCQKFAIAADPTVT